MAEKLSIPPKLAEIFFEAVRAYIRWPFAASEPAIIVDQDGPISISTICSRVDVFTDDPLPDEVFNALYFLNTHRELKEKLSADRTYSTAAQCLLKLIEDRKAERHEG
jgi:hypothetical protein